MGLQPCFLRSHLQLLGMPGFPIHKFAWMLLLASLAACSSTQPSSPPEASGAAHQLSRDEFLLQMKSCLEDHGFSVTLTEDGGISFGELGSRERLDAALAARSACVKAVDPARLEPPPALSESQLTALYEYVVAENGCLRDLGYAVGEPPPEQVFIDTTGGWDPFGYLAEQGTPPATDDVLRCRAVPNRPSFLDQ